MKRLYFIIFIFTINSIPHAAFAQNDSLSKLRLHFPLIDVPQNLDVAYKYPSMQQSLYWANNFYEVSFWGINALSNSLIKVEGKPHRKRRKIFNKGLEYGLGLAFSRYGSELPIPLGVWAHEEFHRSVLGVNGVSSLNGNWLFTRWDGTVFGASDKDLGQLKEKNLSGLLYSYTAGIQSELMFTRFNMIEDFNNPRTFFKNPFYLYNAWYVYNYFSFSTSAATDSVKVLAPPHESKQSHERDFAGSDLTAWVFDMYTPDRPYSIRDTFPNGEGYNRRIGFNSDLNTEMHDFLLKQKKLSLLNFINPAIFCINRIKVSDQFSFNFFLQYAPTHFGNNLSAIMPFAYKDKKYMVGVHKYNSLYKELYGLELGLFQMPLTTNKKLAVTSILHTWIQPLDQSFYAKEGKAGGALEVKMNYQLNSTFHRYIKSMC